MFTLTIQQFKFCPEVEVDLKKKKLVSNCIHTVATKHCPKPYAVCTTNKKCKKFAFNNQKNDYKFAQQNFIIFLDFAS